MYMNLRDLWLNSVFVVRFIVTRFMGGVARFMGVCEIYGRLYEIYGSLRDLWELRDLWGVQGTPIS